ncbi:hypothetical protein CDD83_4189 [Cordyceps sp. RAO-2017]|nr:hypothetical protein CDD83_4189 [Cordyceps sp. RAO-2017]
MNGRKWKTPEPGWAPLLAAGARARSDPTLRFRRAGRRPGSTEEMSDPVTGFGEHRPGRAAPGGGAEASRRQHPEPIPTPGAAAAVRSPRRSKDDPGGRTAAEASACSGRGASEAHGPRQPLAGRDELSVFEPFSRRRIHRFRPLSAAWNLLVQHLGGLRYALGHFVPGAVTCWDSASAAP